MPQGAATGFQTLRAKIAGLTPVRRTGRVSELAGGLLLAEIGRAHV